MIRIAIGFFMVFGAVGSQDFYDECLVAADCAAGDPPSLIKTAILALVGLGLMAWGVYAKRDYLEDMAENELPIHLRKGYMKGATKNKKI
jgi:hypothetical protein